MENLGQIKISNDVIQTIAGFAALEIDGIDKSTSFTDKLFRNHGIKVSVEDDKAIIDIDIAVKYGQVIPDVSVKVQESIVNAVETMAGLKVEKVNVHVGSLVIKKKRQKRKKMTRANNLIMQRKVSREIFMKYLYSRAVSNAGWEGLSQDLDRFLDSVEDDAIEIHKSHGGKEIDMLDSYREVILDSSYLMDAARAVEDNIGAIDAYINEYARNWTTDTMPAVDVAILRLAVAEIKFMFTIPEVVACDEAVNIAKKYCDDDAYKYINGILGSVMKA